MVAQMRRGAVQEYNVWRHMAQCWAAHGQSAELHRDKGAAWGFVGP